MNYDPIKSDFASLYGSFLVNRFKRVSVGQEGATTTDICKERIEKVCL